MAASSAEGVEKRACDGINGYGVKEQEPMSSLLACCGDSTAVSLCWHLWRHGGGFRACRAVVAHLRPTPIDLAVQRQSLAATTEESP